VIEGDDHEQRITEASSESDALDAVADDFAEQYGEPYSVDLLTVLGKFDSEDDALASHPDAT
jgi:hypothetical protein